MAENYKISLGIDFNDGELKNIKKQLTNLTDNTHRVRIDIDNSRLLKQIEHAKKELKELNSAKGNQPSLTVNTQSLEKSLSRVADVIEEVRRSLGTLDDKSGMKSLLSSVNQIATALGKVENESDNLVKSLSALSKKDFSINFDLKMGKSASQISSEQGDIKRDAISQLKQQAKALEDYLDQYYKVAQRQEGVVKLTQGTNLFSSFWEMSPNIGNTKASLKQQVATYKQYIDLMQEAAKIKGVDLSSITSGFSKTTNDIVEETKKVSDGVEEAKQALKGIFGGSLDVEGLSGQLQPIIADLGEIKTALQSLSSNNSIDGLTQSFNRLSETLEKLTANLTLAKNTLDTGFSNTASANNAVKAAQQTGQKIGEVVGKSVTQSAKEHINLDDVVEKETRALMKEYGISAKNKTAKDDIKGALTNYVNEIKNGGTIVNDELFGSFNTADAALRKVTDTIARHKKEVIELDTLYEDLLADIKSVNKGKGATKVRLSDMRAEWGDDYKANKDLLGSWFSDKYTDGIGIDSWVKSKSWSSLLDLSGSHQDIANQLVELVKKAKTKTSYSGDELFKEGFLNIDDVEASVKESAANISAAEQKMAQSSVESANTIVQSEAKKQQAYEETKQKLEEVNRTIAEHNDTITDPAKMVSIGDMDAIQAYMDELDVLEQKKKELESTLKTLEVSDAGKADVGLENLENDLQQVESSAESASDAIQQTANEAKKLDNISIDINDGSVDDLRNALKNIKVDDTSIENATKELDEMNIVAKSVSGTLRDGNLVKWDIKGIQQMEDGLERVVTITNTLKKTSDGNFIWSNATKYSQAFDKIADAASKIQEKLKDTGFDGFDAEMQRVKSSVESLDMSYEDLNMALKQLDVAMDAVSSADQIGDNKRLVAANKEYEASLEKVTSLLKRYQQLEKDAFDAKMLKQTKANLSSEMETWLKENTRAAKEFGAQIRKLQSSLNGLDAKNVKLVKKEFEGIKKTAKAFGKDGLTTFDQIKEKFKEYSAYFSVAEVFMYAEQALTSMFEQVKLIDSAMTELKKVTDETDAAYNQFLGNAASKAKELGTTIDGLVSSTADFARLGYGFEEAQGLAEVANIYAVVGDEIDGVEGATKSLISTLAAFRDQASGISDDDFAMDIVDKFNEVDILAS